MSATVPEPTEQPATGGPSHRTMYLIIGIVLVVLAIIGLFAYSAGSDSREAQQKADQLTQKLQSAGLTVPADQDMITGALGTDGGAVCDNPASALGKATLADNLVNGAAFVGRRPVIVDRRILQAEALILETYCPEKLQPYRDKIDQLKTDDVIKP
jgi:Tfp pilus assembly protein FimT